MEKYLYMGNNILIQVIFKVNMEIQGQQELQLHF